MSKIKVIIDWDENFGAYSELIDGGVATGKTLESVKRKYASALTFHLKGLEKDEIPEEFLNDFELDFELFDSFSRSNHSGVWTFLKD